MLQDYQLLMVAHVNTYGHMLLKVMTILTNTILRLILFAHVLMGWSEWTILPYLCRDKLLL